MAIDSDICLRSFLLLAASLEKELEPAVARTILRKTGHQASVELLEFLPLNLPESEAIKRAGPILEEMGFIRHMQAISEDEVEVLGNVITEELQTLGQDPYISRFFVIGLLEGILQQLSTSQRNVLQVRVEGDREIWSFG